MSKYIAGVNDELWRVPKILEKTGLGRTTFLGMAREGKAPKGIKISHRITVWRASEIQAFIEKLATQAMQRAN